jgi:HSP20 family protein
MQAMRNVMDRYLDEPLFGLSPLLPRSETMGVALDVAEENDGYVIKASVPGVKPEEIDVTMADNVLTIRGEMQEDHEIKEENYHVRERRFGSFMRSVTLPNSANTEKVDATYEHGVLTLHVPKSEAVKPRKIAVHTMIEQK